MMAVHDFSLDFILQIADQMAARIEEENFTPKHILYIERAGLFIGYPVAKYFDCPISGIFSSRAGGDLKSTLKKLLRILPRFITHALREIEIRSKLHQIKKERHIVLKDPLPLDLNDVLIVDDAIDTGYSLLAVRNFLRCQGADLDRIKTAVLTTTAASPAYTADFTFYQNKTIAFPWSYDAREFDQAWGYYQTCRDMVSRLNEK